MSLDNSTSVSRFKFTSIFQKKFRKHVFQLMYEGYAPLLKNDKDYTGIEEEEVSHDLVGNIEAYFATDNAPKWVEKFSVSLEHPISPNGEIGRKRPKLDIRIRTGQRPCPNFVFESKRLNQNTESAEYFGDDGMRAFLVENKYPVNAINEAGMLGYVQTKNVSQWIQWLRKHFKKRTDVFSLPDSDMDLETVIKQLPHTYRSKHKPGHCQGEITIFHVLLVFNGSE